LFLQRNLARLKFVLQPRIANQNCNH
jgi:hypothetical protein